MTRRSVLWAIGAGLYAVVNVGGAAYAIVMGEMPHAAVHVALLLVGVAIWSRFGPTRGDRGRAGGSDIPVAGRSPDLSNRFRNLEQSLDAVAIEVERIGEGQRAMTDLLVDREAPPAQSGGAPEPADVDRKRSSS